MAHRPAKHNSAPGGGQGEIAARDIAFHSTQTDGGIGVGDRVCAIAAEGEGAIHDDAVRAAGGERRYQVDGRSSQIERNQFHGGGALAESQFAGGFQGEGASFSGVGAEEPVGDGDVAFLADDREPASDLDIAGAAGLAGIANRGDGGGGQGFHATRDGQGCQGVFRAQAASELQLTGFNAQGCRFAGVG